MSEINPFPPEDADRHAIWEMLVRRDSDFFLSGDWSLVAHDYNADGFLGIECDKSLDPDDWRPAYPSLAAYRDAAIAGRWSPDNFAEPLRTAWFRCQSMTRIDIAGGRALAHKRIQGSIARTAGGALELGWRSVFHLHRVSGQWKVAGFTGYLPL